MPERFRHAHRDSRLADEALPPEMPLDAALAQLLPVAPAAPQALMAADDLEVALEAADLMDGELPHWHRGRGDAEVPAEIPPEPAGLPSRGDDEEEDY